jgi:hypothetical protein
MILYDHTSIHSDIRYDRSLTIMNLFLEIISQNGIEDIRSKFVEQNVYNIYYIIELQ